MAHGVSWVERVEEAIAADDLVPAIDALATVSEPLRRQAVLLRGRVARAARDEREGLVTAESARVERTRLAHAVLDIALAAAHDIAVARPGAVPDLRSTPGDGRRQPVFLSHATADKPTLVLPVAEHLRRAGVEVWVDARSMEPGDRLLVEIEAALIGCPTFVAFLTPAFLASRWARAELDAVRAREQADGRDRLIPVLHHLTVAEVSDAFPLLADRVMLTSTGDVADLAARLADLVSGGDDGA